MKINERFPWAVSIISPVANENILEIGCGGGILTELIARRLKSGTITAIDRVKLSIHQAKKRNEDHIKSGKVKLIAAEIAKTSFEENQFSKIVSFNVNIFWKGTEKDFLQIHHCIKPKGQLFVFYKTPSGADPKKAEAITTKLRENNFKIVATLFEKPPVDSFCIIAKPL